ncbi:carbamoyl-phosphate synthase large chain [Clostridium pasteurianum DSM 525 = ATCC 6013]|uniref:Carbamoyl phosphate synthase large chain n=1 Tax=Clostridium pasteurianum DSM 525 = ATCC 6013 TaxID=1262449 RepID=A0A0H3J5M1_CLOPA|nr:carbamoyl-phosphate synthase (glutamine-hydrolyzing) large subunit [Clostridium pasteurianum]AJA48749.1 carbamoyl-phosphate synthase large chain [Clostridium pasteurianum DSM 525 = ATCC 6013]AJA52737.1 carbamoyl-phosphate synthase large chain [Clostridium pasteurianum DSM 525 = ATCC 6013]AOZ75972.1 carbamoyl phosphate synthase large subunit [Clostridium pasteurianum DSM 525 = ATCC 6013]AOZ79768.1 carbamoyl phosphate synthase large subunit [Clostridium pasteurianum]ELP60048.1 carbamoyl phosp
MPLDKTIKKALIIGSGPIIIGQAAEFDYSGTEAIKAIKEEGIETVLVNSNPATIMTDYHISDKVYIEPLTVEALEKIIAFEKPDGILAGFGGQTALNLAMKLRDEGILEKYNVRLLGVNSEAIKKAEDREEFKNLMEEINEPIPKSIIATHVDECIEFVNNYGFPVIIRPAYTLGGTGGGIAENMEELIEIASMGIEMSPIDQILLEQSVAGWKEIEYEVIRDKKDNCIIICNMENIDPVGVHTGDSIVVAPSQTLRDTEYQMLRNAAIKIIRNLKIEGGCNIQYALDPKSNNYIVIEVNPRVSRSSALASKAAGYPIAKIAAKIAIGYSLDELRNYVTKNSSACFEPALDYCVVKIPKWPFDKFSTALRTLGTQMKATGEVMAIDRTFHNALLKAVTSLEGKFSALRIDAFEALDVDTLIDKIKKQDDERIFAIAEIMRKGISIDEIHNVTKIDKWFLESIKLIVNTEFKLKEDPSEENIIDAKKMGFTIKEISRLTKITESKILDVLNDNNVKPVYKMVDTCSGEFEADTPYYYSCYEEEEEDTISEEQKIIVLGSGPIRIGQGIEFDYCCVHGVWGIKDAGFKSIIINNNPETVSTDFDTADKLYFESLYIDNVLDIIDKEKPYGVIVQFGGQTAINLAEKLYKKGIKILGTSFKSIDLAEDREKFSELLNNIDIPLPKGFSVTNMNEAYKAVEALGYPVLVRPSYVIGGRAMQVVHDRDTLEKYMKEAVNLSTEHPVLIDKYIRGTEIEVDAISDAENVLIPGIMEHVERTGVHSGDSITMYPTRTLSKDVLNTLKEYTEKIVKALAIKGLVNIQYVFDGENVYVIEVNPRASRTVPILSKVTGIPMVKLAVEIILGKKLKELGYGIGINENHKLCAVKIPVFSNEKLVDVDTYLGPEMKSTGEVLGVGHDFESAIYKGFCAANYQIPKKGNIYVSLKDIDKLEALEVIKKYIELGFNIIASEGTGKFLRDKNTECTIKPLSDIIDNLIENKIAFIIDSPTKGNNINTLGFKLRRKAAEHRIPVFTCIDTANIFVTAVNYKISGKDVEYSSMNKYFVK